MTNTNYRNYKIDFQNGILYLDYKFNRLAQDPENTEYRTYLSLKADFPTFKTIVKSHRGESSKRKNRRLSYKAMTAYINSFNEADMLMEEFNNTREKYNGNYNCVRKWFEDRFPNYGEVYAKNYPITDKVIGAGNKYVDFYPDRNLLPYTDAVIDAVVDDETGEVSFDS